MQGKMLLYWLQHMVVVAQLVRAPGCGPGGHRFKSGLPPHIILSDELLPFWIAWVEKLQWLLPISCFMIIAKHKRILFAVNGMIFALRLKTPDVPPALLYDFNDMKYERLPAPYACPDSM